MPANDPATRLEVCVLPEEGAIIRAFARSLGKNTSEFVRECVLDRIKTYINLAERANGV